MRQASSPTPAYQVGRVARKNRTMQLAWRLGKARRGPGRARFLHFVPFDLAELDGISDLVKRASRKEFWPDLRAGQQSRARD